MEWVSLLGGGRKGRMLAGRLPVAVNGCAELVVAFKPEDAA
jgi:hypothetical protein